MERTRDLGCVLVPRPLTLHPHPLSSPPQFFSFLRVTSLSAPLPPLHLLHARAAATTTNGGKVCFGTQTVWIQIDGDQVSMLCRYKVEAHSDSERFFCFIPHAIEWGSFGYLTSPAQLLHKHMGKIMRGWGHATAQLKTQRAINSNINLE